MPRDDDDADDDDDAVVSLGLGLGECELGAAASRRTRRHRLFSYFLFALASNFIPLCDLLSLEQRSASPWLRLQPGPKGVVESLCMSASWLVSLSVCLPVCLPLCESCLWHKQL